MPMDDLALFQRIGLAVAIGAAIGVERHWREREGSSGSRTAGIRTYTLIGMLGGIAALLEHQLAPADVMSGITLVGFFITFTVTFALFQLREEIAEKSFSATSVVVAMLTFALGALAVLGDLTVACAAAVVTIAVLASRDFLHELIRKLRWEELRSAVILLAMAFVILPLVPTERFGPFGGISPSEVFVMAIVLAGISYCGYVAVRLLGNRKGELVAGAIAGLISSTAATITNARKSHAGATAAPLAAGAIAASGVSLLRTAVLVTALAPALVWDLVLPLIVGMLVSLSCAGILSLRDAPEHEQLPLRNPFELASIFKLALLLVGVGFIARAATTIWGDRGLLVVSALSGLADVDAATVTVAGMLGSLAPAVASLAIAIAVIANLFAKAFYALLLGSRAFALQIWGATVLAVLGGALCHFLQHSLTPA
jgi:uncharacterized membrane protein (DUF4010 family)